mmetsp:Transcript_63426/g.139616  ORF Transcript_63426/g.139616 Transcript_63426/m.139616 type:complete len:80 (-) Transcript_63426:3-242(-)
MFHYCLIQELLVTTVLPLNAWKSTTKLGPKLACIGLFVHSAQGQGRHERTGMRMSAGKRSWNTGHALFGSIALTCGRAE